MRSAAALLLILAAGAAGLALAGGGGDAGRDADGRPGGGTARVLRVVDGDTIVVGRAGGRTDTVRYIGIDTPESVKPDTPVQCYAKAASHENERLVAGRTVRLVVGAEPRDRYGRLLAYVYADGALVNARLLAGGFARTLTIPPNDRFANRFSVLQMRARRAGRGLWGAC